MELSQGLSKEVAFLRYLRKGRLVRSPEQQRVLGDFARGFQERACCVLRCWILGRLEVLSVQEGLIHDLKPGE